MGRLRKGLQLRQSFLNDLEELSKEAKSVGAVDVVLRICGLIMVSRQPPYGKIAQCLGVTIGAVSNWVGNFEREGYQGLLTRPRAGRPAHLAEAFPAWLKVQVTPRWYELYANRSEEYRFLKGESSRAAYLDEVGQHGFRLLKAIEESGKIELQRRKSDTLLQQMWEQQLEIKAARVVFLPAEKLAPVGERFDSPYDAEAKDLLPQIHLVDAGYPDNDWMIASEKGGIRVVGPARPNYHWQAKANQGFALKDFVIDWEQKEVLCPAGKLGKNWSTSNAKGHEKYRVRFKSSDCLNCPKRKDCTKSKRWRVVSFADKERQAFLEKARTETSSQEWQKLYQERADIEGTISQGVRGFHLRQSRYLGKAKTHFHNLAIAAAINVVRGVAGIEGKPLEKHGFQDLSD